jgi:hypothetical protein
MRKSNFALRLQPSLLEELRTIAASEGVALNQLINVAVAEKLSALRTEDYFRNRARHADRSETNRILEKAGVGNPVIPGDELPSGIESIRAPKRIRAKTRKLENSSNRRKQK